MTKLKSFYNKCVRVWRTLKKPSKEEFQMVSKISAIGIAVIGVIGFIFSIVIKEFFF